MNITSMLIGGEKILNYIREHPLIAIFALAVFVRLLLILFFPLPYQAGGNFELYHRIAENVIVEGDFGGEPEQTYGSPSVNPGWPFFLIGFYLLFGISHMGLLLASIFFSGLIAAGTYLLSFCFFSRRVSVLAGVTAALWPPFLIQTFTYTDSILFYTTLLVWSVFLFVKAIRGRKWPLAVLAGGLLGFAALVDPIAFFIPLMFLVWVAVKQFSLRSLGLTLLFGTVFISVITPWAYRNILVAESTGSPNPPVISKGELQLLSPDRISLISQSVMQDGVILSGLSQMFIFPFSIHVLDQHQPYRSYKEIVRNLLAGQDVPLDNREITVLAGKGVITILHLFLLGFAFWGAVKFRSSALAVLALLLLGYVAAASIGYGSQWNDDFQSVSLLSSFLFPLLPFLMILASARLLSLKRRRLRF